MTIRDHTKMRPDPNDTLAETVERLPRWLLAKCISTTDDDLASLFVLQSTANNGDCLFHSIRLCLFELMDNPYTSHELRWGVAKTILNEKDQRAKSALQLWKAAIESAKSQNGDLDKELIIEYLFALPLLRVEPDENGIFPQGARREVFENMMKSNIYWGDQYALLVLQELLNVNIIVLKKHLQVSNTGVHIEAKGQIITSSQQSNDNDDDQVAGPELNLMLCLDEAHYRPIIQNLETRCEREFPFKTLFEKENIPDFISRCF